MENQRLQDFERTKRLVWVLGLVGLIPFLACALVVLILGVNSPISNPAIAIFRNYSVVILSFLGGVRWGYALVQNIQDESKFDRLSISLSVIPSLIAWLTLFMSQHAALAVLLVAFCAQGAWDSLAANSGRLPQWFAPLRITLTLIVAICHAVMILVAV